MPTIVEYKEKYLVPNYEIHLMPDMAYVRPPNGEKNWRSDNDDGELPPRSRNPKYPPKKTSLRSMRVVNGVARDLYLLADGRKRAEEVYVDVLKKNNASYGTHKAAIYDFLQQMVDLKHLKLSDKPKKTSIAATGSEEYFYPAHISIEVTSACNLRCIHCYGYFGMPKSEPFSSDKIISYLEDMRDNGLRSIELTGGECMTHPEFDRILKWCCEYLDLIGVLTNGTLFTEETFDIMSAYADKLALQICINGNEKTHNEFTKSKTAYKKAMSAIRRLAQAGVLVRTPMNVHLGSYEQVLETGRALYEVGSTQFLATPINERFGRAQDIHSSKKKKPAKLLAKQGGCSKDVCHRILNGEEHSCKELAEMYKKMYTRTSEQLDQLEKEFPAFVKKEFSEDEERMREHDKSCGAGRRVYYISCNGDVCLCPMAVESGIPKFGNIVDCTVKELCSSEFAHTISHLPMPNEKDCLLPDGKLCPSFGFDKGCILNGLTTYMKKPKECPWGEKHNVATLFKTGKHELEIAEDGSWQNKNN